MSEQTLWEWLKGYLPLGQFSRIESGDTAPGFPDVFYQLSGKTGLIELKSADNPRRAIPFNQDDGLRKSQKIWIRENLNHGGTVWIVAEIGDDVLFIPGRYYKVFNGAKSTYLYAIAELVITKRKVKARQLRRLKRLLEQK